MWPLVLAAVATADAACLFCGNDAQGRAATFDLSGLPNKTFTLQEASGYGKGSYLVAPPCGCAATAWTARGLKCTPMTQGGSRGLADLVANVSVAVGDTGVNVTIGDALSALAEITGFRSGLWAPCTRPGCHVVCSDLPAVLASARGHSARGDLS